MKLTVSLTSCQSSSAINPPPTARVTKYCINTSMLRKYGIRSSLVFVSIALRNAAHSINSKLWVGTKISSRSRPVGGRFGPHAARTYSHPSASQSAPRNPPVESLRLDPRRRCTPPPLVGRRTRLLPPKYASRGKSHYDAWPIPPLATGRPPITSETISPPALSYW